MLRRVSNYLTYLALAIPRAIMVRSDVILAMTDPPIAGIAGAIVSRVTGRPFVYNIRDLYPDMAVGGDIVRPGLAVRIWERMHRWALRRAVRVIVLGDDMRDRIIAKGVDPTRISVVRDGVTIPEELPAPGNAVTQEIRSGFQFVALHAGNIGFYGAWDTLLEAARRLGDSGSAIIFVGEGAQKGRLVAAAGEASSCRFHAQDGRRAHHHRGRLWRCRGPRQPRSRCQCNSGSRRTPRAGCRNGKTRRGHCAQL
jgi:colanic acid biosynthesis glycosyl transferase WcaI